MQQNWLHCIFLFLAFIVSWAAWVLFGVFATVRIVVGDVCGASADWLDGKPGAQELVPCPDMADAVQFLDSVHESIAESVRFANDAIAGALQPPHICSRRAHQR